MVWRVTPEFCCSEAERLMRLAISSIDRDNRSQLLDIAAHYRELAADLQRKRGDAADSNDIKDKDSETV